MLIISKFHDYYDSAIAHGIDKSVVYKRDTKIEGKDRPDKYRSMDTVPSDNKRWYTEGFLLGFCGKLYPYYKLTEAKENNPEVKFFYEYEKLEKFLNLKNKKVANRDRWSWRGREPTKKEWFDANTHTSRGLDALFLKERCPVFTWSQNYYGSGVVTVINPCLKDINFQQVLDPYTAFQEIYMYISGVLGTNENDMVDISDKDMLKKRGFDKWSFKKLPTKRK